MYQQTVVLRRGSDRDLDPIAHLLELRWRIRLLRRRRAGISSGSDSFWIREGGGEYSYNAMAALVRTVLRDVGISNARTYHIKHAAATALVDAKVAGDRVTEFLCHKQGSTLYLSNYADRTNDDECTDLLAKL
jgi:hypothetical protein